MKRLRILLILAVTTVVACTIVGCSSCGGEKKATSFDSIPQLTKADTERVFNQTAQFMETLKNGMIDSALNMLSENVDGEAFPLIDSVRTRYKKQFERFPVLDYEIETSDFRRHEYATATYRYKFMENPTNDPNYPCTLRLTIENRLLSGHYVLLLHDYMYITR